MQYLITSGVKANEIPNQIVQLIKSQYMYE